MMENGLLTSRQFLCVMIEHNHRVTRCLQLDLRCRHQILVEPLQRKDMAVLESLTVEVQLSEQEKCKTRQKRKFDALLRSSQEWKTQGFRDHASNHAKWVVNLSSRTLSSAEESVLSKGLNFAPAPSKIPAAHMGAAVDSGHRCLPEEAAELARTKVICTISKARPPPMNMLPQECHAIKNLQKDDSIVVLPADKGRATVVLDVVQYDQKMNSLLTDSKTYKKLTKDPNPSLERKMNEMLLQLKKSGSITSSLYDKLRSSAGRLPLLYGLPKVHKPEVPLRPIVSFLRSPTYQLSKHLATILSPLVGNSPSMCGTRRPSPSSSSHKSFQVTSSLSPSMLCRFSQMFLCTLRQRLRSAALRMIWTCSRTVQAST